MTQSYGPVQPLNLQNSFNVIIIVFCQDWKDGPDVLKPPCLAPDGINSGIFKVFGHTGLIIHISQPPARILFAKLPHVLCFLCNKRIFYWPLFLKNISWSFTRSFPSSQTFSLPQLVLGWQHKRCWLQRRDGTVACAWENVKQPAGNCISWEIFLSLSKKVMPLLASKADVQFPFQAGGSRPCSCGLLLRSRSCYWSELFLCTDVFMLHIKGI